MEIQIISTKFEQTRTGKDKWLVTTSVGQMSVWDEKLADELEKKRGQKVDIEIRPAQEGTNYLPTITGMVGVSAGKVLKEVQNGERSLNGQEQKSASEERPEQWSFSNKDKSTIAQCLVKAVIGQPCGSNETFDIKAAIEMYKKALELLG